MVEKSTCTVLQVILDMSLLINDYKITTTNLAHGGGKEAHAAITFILLLCNYTFGGCYFIIAYQCPPFIAEVALSKYICNVICTLL